MLIYSAIHKSQTKRPGGWYSLGLETLGFRPLSQPALLSEAIVITAGIPSPLPPPVGTAVRPFRADGLWSDESSEN